MYDILGNVIRATDANGVNIVNEYDKANRVIRRCYSKPNVVLASTVATCASIPTNDRSTDTPPVEFFYDGKGLASQQTPNFAKGKLTKVTSSVSETQYQLFDNFGRMTQSAQITDGQTYTSKYVYNLSGALVEEEYPSGRKVKNEFEPDGGLLTVASKKAGTDIFRQYASNFSYTSSGGISQMRLGNGRWETAKFNTRSQVEELGLGTSAINAGLWKVNYANGELAQNGTDVDATKNTGNIAKQTLTIPGATFVQTYRYDSLYRLKEAVEPGAGSTANWTQTFDYDRYRNRTSFIQTVGGVTTHNSTPAVSNGANGTNRFTSADFEYDKNGNLVGDIDPATSQPRDFLFNADNKQREVIVNGTPVGSYFYDGEGKRVKKVVGDETTVFVYSAGKLIAEYSTTGPPAEGHINYTTTDHLGSPRIITNELGQVQSRRDFMPFGEDLNAGIGNRTAEPGKYSVPGDKVRQKFTGYQKDEETKLDFAEARMYENRHGRFTAVDPLLASGKSANPQTFNRYIYVGNNPTIITDPLGLDWYQRGNRFLWSSDNKVFDDGTSVDGWTAVQFDSTGYYAYDCEGCGSGEQAYLHQNGGWDNGLRAQVFHSLMEHNRLANSFNDPKLLAIRHPEVAERGGDAMWMGAAVFNIPLETYNFGAWGANKFGGNLPYAPTITPDENTSPGGKLFFYGTNAGLAGRAAVSLFSGLWSGVNTIRSGGLSFSAYKATQGPSEILGTVPTVTRSGRPINYLIRTEQSHMFISQAMQRKHNLPNWLVNNRINVWKLNTIQHALIDPQRYKFLPVGLKSEVGLSPLAKYNFFTRSFE